MHHGFETFLTGMAFFIGLIFAAWGCSEWRFGRESRTPRKPPTRPPYRPH